MTLKIYLPVYFLIYLSVAFVLPTLRVWRQTGVNPVAFGAADTAHDFIGRAMKALFALLAVAVAAWSAGGAAYRLLLPAQYLEGVWLQRAGLGLMHLSLVWIAIAQAQMARSWRIGIDEAHPTELVTAGVFAHSRNPVFLGMLCSMGGLFLFMPNALTLLLCGVAWVLIQIQVRLEEAFLESRHGDAYRAYRKRVRRFF